MNDLQWIGHIEGKVDQGKISREEANILLESPIRGDADPEKFITPVPRFHSCIKAFEDFFSSEEPPIIVTRSKKCYVLIYGFVDASGSGFGSTLQERDKIHYRIGTWSSIEENNSSNWREFENLVCTVEEAGKKGMLSGSTVLLATDNSTVEAALYKGNSSSEKCLI